MATDRDSLARALAGADYPAGKEELEDLAKRNGADEATVKAVRALQPEQYQTFDDVLASARLDAAAEEGQTDREKAKQNRQANKSGLAEHMTRTPANPIEEEIGENPKKS